MSTFLNILIHQKRLYIIKGYLKTLYQFNTQYFIKIQNPPPLILVTSIREENPWHIVIIRLKKYELYTQNLLIISS